MVIDTGLFFFNSKTPTRTVLRWVITLLNEKKKPVILRKITRRQSRPARVDGRKSKKKKNSRVALNLSFANRRNTAKVTLPKWGSIETTQTQARKSRPKVRDDRKKKKVSGFLGPYRFLFYFGRIGIGRENCERFINRRVYVEKYLFRMFKYVFGRRPVFSRYVRIYNALLSVKKKLIGYFSGLDFFVRRRVELGLTKQNTKKKNVQ